MKYLLGAIFLVIISCSKDDPKVTNYYLTQTTIESTWIPADPLVYHYNYQDRIQVSWYLHDSLSINVNEYDDQGRLVRILTRTNLLFFDTVATTDKIVLTYSGEDIVKQEWFHDKYVNVESDTMTGMETYEYSANRLVKRVKYAFDGEKWIEAEIADLEYSDDTYNVSSITYHYPVFSGGHDLINKYTYGDQKAATSAAPPAMLKYYRLSFLPTDKNILTLEGYQYYYAFDAQGYPTTESRRMGNSIDYVKKYSYTWE